MRFLPFNSGLSNGMFFGACAAVFTIVLKNGEITPEEQRKCQAVLTSFSPWMCKNLLHFFTICKAAFHLGTAGFFAERVGLLPGNEPENINIANLRR
jgi:hypothetical protein